MQEFKNSNNETKGETSAIIAYFKRNDESVAQFSEQLKKLSPADKTELAIGTAKELGWTEVRVRSRVAAERIQRHLSQTSIIVWKQL